MDPILWLVLAPIITAAITQTGKFLVELSGVNVSAVAAQIAAWVVATALSVIAQAHLPIYLGPVLQAAQPIITGAVATALSFVAHDLAAALQGIMAWLQRFVPQPGSAGKA